MVYLRYVSDISQVYFRHISCIYLVNVMYSMDISQRYLRRALKKQAQICAEGCEEEYFTRIF